MITCAAPGVPHMTSKWPTAPVPSPRRPESPLGKTFWPCPARETAQARPVSGERSSRDTSTGATSSASISNTRPAFDRCSAAATAASVSPAPPLTLVQALSSPRGFLGPTGLVGIGTHEPMRTPLLALSRGPRCEMRATTSAGGVDAGRTWSTPRPIFRSLVALVILLRPGHLYLEQLQDAPLGVGEAVKDDPICGVVEAKALEGGQDIAPGRTGGTAFR